MSNLEDKLRDVLTKLIQDTWDVSGEGHNGEYSMLTHPGGKQYTDDEILADVIRRLADYHGSAFPIEQIIQAFKEEGWVHIPQAELVERWERDKPSEFRINGEVVKSGPEWYAALIEELRSNPNVTDIPVTVLKAARRASGMEEKK